jgi:hypothetical protein
MNTEQSNIGKYIKRIRKYRGFIRRLRRRYFVKIDKSCKHVYNKGYVGRYSKTLRNDTIGTQY